jgi:hypothetical protein
MMVSSPSLPPKISSRAHPRSTEACASISVGAVLTVYPVFATLAARAVVLEVVASGSAAVVAGTAVEQVVAMVAVELQVVAILTTYRVNRRVAVQV